MNIEELKYQILQQFGFPPTPEQAQALDVFVQFMTDSNPHAVMILRGSAGTGKTSLSGAIVRTLRAVRQKVMLLAPTGRAAKVFSLNSGMPAYTIHRRIYREKAFAGEDGQFNLNDNLYTDTLFMVDEASMIANLGLGGTTFGSGCLLDDLIHFVYQGRNDRLLLIGDKAQLPPVGEEESPALSAAMLQGYGLSVYECDLNEVVRQSQQSGILFNATRIRQMITHDDITQLPKIRFSGFSDIREMPGAELIEALGDSYHHVGLDDTIVVTRSNKRANIFNQGIRNIQDLLQFSVIDAHRNNMNLYLDIALLSCTNRSQDRREARRKARYLRLRRLRTGMQAKDDLLQTIVLNPVKHLVWNRSGTFRTTYDTTGVQGVPEFLALQEIHNRK